MAGVGVELDKNQRFNVVQRVRKSLECVVDVEVSNVADV